MGPHGIGGGRASGDRWPRMVVGQFSGAVLVLGGELHGRVRVAHGGHARAGAGSCAASSGGVVRTGNRSRCSATGRRASVERWTAAARARAAGIAADTGAARVSVRRDLRMRDHADADHLLQLPERFVIDG